MAGLVVHSIFSNLNHSVILRFHASLEKEINAGNNRDTPVELVTMYSRHCHCN